MHPCNDSSRRRLQVSERVLGVWLLASFCIWFQLVCLHLLGKLWFCEICSVGACFPGKDWLLKLGFAKLGSLLCLWKGEPHIGGLVSVLVPGLFYANPLCRCLLRLARLLQAFVNRWWYAETWLILPVVICLSQRLSHACLSISFYTAKLRMAH